MSIPVSTYGEPNPWQNEQLCKHPEYYQTQYARENELLRFRHWRQMFMKFCQRRGPQDTGQKRSGVETVRFDKLKLETTTNSDGQTNILQITNDNWCHGFLHCNLTHFILHPLMSADLHHVYPATFQPHRSAVPATGGQAPGDDWTIPFQGRKCKGIRIDTWQPQARENKQQAKSSSDEASQCYSTKVILLEASIPSILGIKKIDQRTSESSMDWYFHSPHSIDSCWLSCVTRWSWDLFVLLSCHRPYP